MYERPFRLEMVAPDRIVFQGEAESFSAPGVEGGFQVLFNHAPLLSSLDIGQVRIRQVGGGELRYAVTGGTVEVRGNTVSVLVESAERADEIDLARAQAARDRARARIQGQDPGTDLERAQLALRRALNRIKTAEKG